MKKLLLILIILVISVLSVFAAPPEETEHKLTFFYSDTCPHCHKENIFLDKIEGKYPQLKIERFEISQPGVIDLARKMAEEQGFTPRGVPITFVNNKYFVGFDTEETTGNEIEAAIVECLGQKVPYCAPNNKSAIKLPGGWEIDAGDFSLPLFTIIIGGLDGFNPCAMWVLTFLLSLLIYAKSRKKMLLIGGVFVITSGAIYFLFMTAWLNFFLLVGYVTLMRLIIAAIAILFGALNIKELIWFKKGPSLTISDKHKPKLFEKMRKIVNEQQTYIAIFATMTLAIFVNFIELLCTAGLPAIYTNILVSSNLSSLAYYFYLFLYNVIYVIPLLIIVLVFVFTMGRHKFTDKQGKILKLVSGLLMLLLGLIMLIRPELLNFA